MPRTKFSGAKALFDPDMQHVAGEALNSLDASVPESYQYPEGIIQYNMAICNVIKEVLGRGVCLEEIPAYLDISKDRLDSWCKEHPELVEAIAAGYEKSKAWFYAQGRQNLMNKHFNTQMWNGFMQNEYGWTGKRTQVTQVPKTEQKLIDFDTLDDDEVKLLNELVNRKAAAASSRARVVDIEPEEHNA